ncbi:transcriptional regulator, TetR family [Nitrosomonas europaea]|uniref:Bacterial regulatory proteins, TetR family n=2 Tax=Nitrosomonadaceae TaxID=206379 RepID=Q82TE7_NITEU|nr:Bacterial regulatory proteins, TetR family [Nitrosomonas europaea ATCC 19718]SDW96870.1 transcriptional regulator, TetR family [Nitrosomonas europaea]SES99916.1 transcriptional regulator, TetR family [Nitrosomonas europaea]SJZ50953.1 transcriptional regulator, TetR family [Nitrosomonas europaea]
MLTTMAEKISVEEKILQTARRLFCQVGIHATGIARIIEESGVSRRSLYTHYGSKENLLKAVFEAEANIWFRWFDCDLPQMECSPTERILALFDLMRDWFDSKNFYGCVFINAVAEHEKSNGWIQEVANSHREKITAKLQAMVAASGAQNPEMVTEKLNLLIDGTIVTAMVTANSEIAHIGKLAAGDILRNAQ